MRLNHMLHQGRKCEFSGIEMTNIEVVKIATITFWSLCLVVNSCWMMTATVGRQSFAMRIGLQVAKVLKAQQVHCECSWKETEIVDPHKVFQNKK